MTTSGETILEEIVAGLQGVTPGPWESKAEIVRTLDEHANGGFIVAQAAGPCWKRNAAHLSRCAPDAIRAIASYVAERDAEAERRKASEVIVDRIWDIFGRPSYEELAGRSIYDLIETQKRARAEAVAERDALKAALERLQMPLNNSVPLPRWAAGIVKKALDNGGQG